MRASQLSTERRFESRAKWFVTTAFLAAEFFTIGCGSRKVDETEATRPTGMATAALPAPVEPDYDAQGNLRPSNARSFGILLPRTLEEISKSDHHANFGSNAPLSKMQKYFSERLFTGDIGRDGSGALLIRNATVRGSSSPVRLNVAIRSNSRFLSVVEIEEVIPPEAAPPAKTTQEVTRHLENYMLQGE